MLQYRLQSKSLLVNHITQDMLPSYLEFFHTIEVCCLFVLGTTRKHSS